MFHEGEPQYRGARNRPSDTVKVAGGKLESKGAVGIVIMAERGGFDPLNVEPCNALHDLVQTRETKHLSGFRHPPDLIGVF